MYDNISYDITFLTSNEHRLSYNKYKLQIRLKLLKVVKPSQIKEMYCHLAACVKEFVFGGCDFREFVILFFLQFMSKICS